MNIKSLLISDTDICPVAIYKMHIEKLHPARKDLWQKPKKKIRGNETEWYENQVVGRDPLNEMMKTLSEDANLSRIYTNHSIRATCLTKLDEAGFEIRHMQAVSGHKSEESIKAYSKKCPETKKREMSEALNIFEPPAKITKKPSATVSKIPAHDTEFIDFVPIDNNEDDFDLGSILKEVSEDPNINFDNIQPNAVTPITASETIPTTEQSENAPVPASQNNYIQNFNNQTHPFVPKMMFHNSTVTINYNFYSNK